MRRRLARPFGHNASQTRLLSLLMALVVIGLIYHRAKEPQLWDWLTNESRADNSDDFQAAPPKVAATTNGSQQAAPEHTVPGPNETDPDELAKLQTNLKAVQDRHRLQEFEMSAYWQLMRWSRTRPFAELEKLSRRDVPYSHLWEEPDLYRGQPMRLKLHVRRVLKYAPSKNPQDLNVTYEAWGWTEDSRSFPFCVVFPDKPADLRIGTDVEGDIVFVGYFLKWMSYDAFDTKKNAPLLIGRVRPATRTAGAASNGGWELAFLKLIGVVLLLSVIGWFAIYGLRRPRTIVAATTSIPDQLPANWGAAESGNSLLGLTGADLDFASVAAPVSAETTSSVNATQCAAASDVAATDAS